MKDNTFTQFYLTPKIIKNLIIGQCSVGRGVFAAEHINIGEKILEFGGRIITSKSLPYPYEAEKDYFLQIDLDLYLGPSGELDDFVNHSCSPNCGVRIKSNIVELVAISSIQHGDQITFNYSTTMDSNWGELTCTCGSDNCTGIVKKFLELPPLAQKKYIELDMVPNYILEKIRSI